MFEARTKLMWCRHQWDRQQKEWVKTEQTLQREEMERKTKEEMERKKALEEAKLE